MVIVVQQTSRGSILPQQKQFISTNIFCLLSNILVGYLCLDELKEALSDSLNAEVTWKHVRMVREEFDKDGDGRIDMSEFVIMRVSALISFVYSI